MKTTYIRLSLLQDQKWQLLRHWVYSQFADGRNVIVNASRPLFGEVSENSWQLPFIHGRHYAAYAQDSNDYERLNELNGKQDARRLVFVDDDLAFEYGRQYFMKYGEWVTPELLERLRDDVIQQGLLVMKEQNNEK